MGLQRKNLILGTIMHYKFHIIRPFFSTLSSTGYTGDVALFHSSVGLRAVSQLRKRGVILVPFGITPPYLEPVLAKHLVRWADEKRLITLNLSCFRFLLAYCYLKEFAEKYQYVMLSDIRDVIFQKDPFNFSIGKNLCCFLEREGVSLGQQPHNAEWMEVAFDKPTLERLSGNPIVCSGITIGPTNLIIDYLEKMIELFMRAPGKAWEVAQPVAGTQKSLAIDQAVHNYLMSSGLLTEFTLYPNDDGPVFTVGIEDSISLNNSGLIINNRGVVPNVVHQYDRHWNVAKRYYSVRLLCKYGWPRVRPAFSKALSEHTPKFHQILLFARTKFFR
jgi:hypothetical protein